MPSQKFFRCTLTILAVLLGAFLFVRYLLPVLLPFLLGLAVALLVQKPIAFLTGKLHFPRGLSVLLAVLLLFTLLGFALFFLGRTLLRELTTFLHELPTLLSSLTDLFTQLRTQLYSFASRLPDGLGEGARAGLDSVFQSSTLLGTKLYERLFSFASALLSGLPGGALFLVAAVVSSFMLAAELPQLRRSVSAFLSQHFPQRSPAPQSSAASSQYSTARPSPQHRSRPGSSPHVQSQSSPRTVPQSPQAQPHAVPQSPQQSTSSPNHAPQPQPQVCRTLPQRIRATLLTWLSAQGKIMLITFLIILTGLLLLRTDFPLVSALIIAVVDALPVFGTGTILIPWAAISFLRRNTRRAVALLILYICAYCTRQSLEPRLIGHEMGIPSVIMLLAIYTGFHFFGIVGGILSPLLVVFLKQILDGYTLQNT